MLKIAFLVTEDWYFVSHRLQLGIAARKAGYEVVVITRCRDHAEAIRSAGLRVLPLEMDRRGLSPLGLTREILQVVRLYLSERPDIVHHVALRPVLVGGVAARLVGIKNVVSALAGMGFLFTDNRHDSFISKSLKCILPLLVGRGRAIVQNSEDATLLTKCSVPQEKIRLVPGSGVNTEEYQPQLKESESPVVMMASRLLLDKGVLEFVEAARIVNRRQKVARFVLVGEPDHDNPASVHVAQIQQWVVDGAVEAWGRQEKMSEILPQATIFCLPSSYREGMPKALLEAMACGLPCITTNAPGCRDAVRHEDNGLLVPIKDAKALAEAIIRLLQNPDERLRMGARGRERAEKEFNQEIIIQQTLDVYREIIITE
jgi:glycosyltransferase involved in cell wall biosynthesis